MSDYRLLWAFDYRSRIIQRSNVLIINNCICMLFPNGSKAWATEINRKKEDNIQSLASYQDKNQT